MEVKELKESPSLDSPIEEEERIEDEELLNSIDTLSYYGVLNVSIDASPEEIKASYKRLSMLFHPDKHQSPKLKELASAKFNQINNAYEILSDPDKRKVYDLYGKDGVDTLQHWQVGPTLKSSTEIQAMYERHELLMKKIEMEDLIKSNTGQLEVTIDASTLFDSKVREIKRNRLSIQNDEVIGLSELLLPKVSGLRIIHSTEVGLSAASSISLSGVIMSKGSQGGGYVVSTYHREFSESKFIQASAAIGNSNFFALKGGRKLSKYSNINGTMTFQNWDVSVPPMLEATYECALGEGMKGDLTYRTGEYSIGSWGTQSTIPNDSVELSFTRSTGKSSFMAGITAGTQESSLIFKYIYNISKAALLISSLKLSTSEYSISAGGDRTVFSKAYRIGAKVQCSSNIGISLNFEASRYSQKLSIPIIFTPIYSRLDILLFATAIPLCGGFFFQKFIIEPFRKKTQLQRMNFIKEQTKETILQKKQEAIDAIRLIKETLIKRIEQERAIDGLIISLARYGVIPEDESINSVSEYWIDVTEAVQASVINSKLQFPDKISKASIIGFYDPIPWNPDKKLFVRYNYKSKLHEVLLDDSDSLFAPMRYHIIEN